MKARIPPLVLFSLGCILFVALELALIEFLDRPLSQFIRTLDPRIINVFRAYTDLGKSLWYLWPSGLGMLLCLALARWRQIPKLQRNRFRQCAETLGFFFACVAGAGIVTDIIKPIVGRARPVVLDHHGFYGFIPLSFHADYNSFPSGHTTTAFAVAFALIALWPQGRSWLIAFAVALGLSRIMVNAHYLSDVLAGAVVGTLTVFEMRSLFSRFGLLFRQRTGKKIFDLLDYELLRPRGRRS